MAVDPDLGRLEAEADRAAVDRRLDEARRLLAEITTAAPDIPGPWMKLAALARAQGDLPAALDALSGALRIDPLGFVPLLMRASVLEALGEEDHAGRQYGYALAQKPDPVPPELATQLAFAEQAHRRWQDRSEERMEFAIARQGLDPPELSRLARFRSNISGRTRHWHSDPSHFHYPGLAELEFHDGKLFPWLSRLEAATNVIRSEFEALVATELREAVPYIQYDTDQPLRQWKSLNWNPDWTALHLLRNGERVEANARHCPETLAILTEIEQPQIIGRSPNAMFSLLAPGTRIPPHQGVANTRLVCHLPLIVPSACWFRVGAETRPWEPGRAFIFDDTIEHEAANESDQLRVVLIFDIWHPDLTAGAREAVAATMAASDGGDTRL